MSETARLLTPPHNWAVVQLPEREFPGSVIQGDTLANLVSLVREATTEADEDEKTAMLNEALEILEGGLDVYKVACRKAGQKLPFGDQN